MNFWEKVLQLLDAEMKTPELYGWFHILFLTLTVFTTILLCVRGKDDSPRRVNNLVFFTAVVVFVLEIYKQINYSFSYGDGVRFDFQWYAFPFQFCSTPMYVGLLTGLFRKGRVQKALYAYLATYSVFAGLCVMVYPADVFVKTIGINIQTMICHGSMIAIGIYLLYTGAVKLEHRTLFGAMAVFSVAVGIAVVLNEIAYYSGLLETETFNMFFVSRHCDPSLPVYSLVQAVVPYPWCLIVYIWGFTSASYLLLLLAMAVKQLASLLRHSTEKGKLTVRKINSPLS